MQHEVGRGLAAVLVSNLKLASLSMMLGIQVRNCEFAAMDAKFSQAVLARAHAKARSHQSFAQLNSLQMQMNSLQTQQRNAAEPSENWTSSQEREHVDYNVLNLLPKLLGSDTLRERRLDMMVGPYGFELLSAGGKKEVVEHAARSLLYADMHNLQIVVAVHVKVHQATSGVSKRRPSFPAWPDLGAAAKRVNPSSAPCICHRPNACSILFETGMDIAWLTCVTDHQVDLLHVYQVIPVDMLIGMESRQVRLSYRDTT